jgi:hypothetical protein
LRPATLSGPAPAGATATSAMVPCASHLRTFTELFSAMRMEVTR